MMVSYSIPEIERDYPGAVIFHHYNELSEMGDVYDEDKFFHHMSVRSGYLPEDILAKIPYDGKYGIGYIILEHRSKKTVTAKYYV